MRKSTGKGRKEKVIVAVSGGLDPIHIGHIRMIDAAKALGDELVVILNNDHWLRAKKGYVFMSEEERKEVVSALRSVDRVIITDHTPGDPDRSVCRALQVIKPTIFANGGDRKKITDIPEAKICNALGIKMVFNVGQGGKVQSSSWLVDASKQKPSVKLSKGVSKKSFKKSLSRRALR